MKKKIINVLIPFISVILCSFLLFSSIDKKGEDLFQRFLPPLKENPEVLMIKVDDDSVANIGTWPFSRDVYARTLIGLKDLGVESVVFDLSFLDKSQAKVDERYVKETLPVYIDSYFSNLGNAGQNYMSAFSDGVIGSEDLPDAVESWWVENNQAKEELKVAVERIMDNSDEAFASSLKFFGNVYLSVTMDDGAELTAEEINFLNNYVALDNIVSDNDTITPEVDGMQPSLIEFISNAKKAGFVNASPDKDGYLRRLNPVIKYKGKYYGQLILVPVLAHLGNPDIIVSNKSLKIGSLVVPRSTDGTILIKYPKKLFNGDKEAREKAGNDEAALKKAEGYNSIPLWNVYRLSIDEEKLANNLNLMDQSGFFDIVDADKNPNGLYEAVKYIRGELYNGEDEEFGITYEVYNEYLASFYAACGEYLTDENLSYMESVYPDDKEYVDELFTTTRDIYNSLMAARERVSAKVKNAICIVGTCATSTSDYGLNLYEEQYPNPGVHYAFANMLLSNDFIDDTPFYVSIFLALCLCMLYELLATLLKGTGKQIAIGIISIIVTFAGLFAYFYFTRQYIGITVPLSSMLLSFICTTAVAFIAASKDKKFITNAFSQCLSKDVIKEIIANPDSFKLGGRRIEMTAMFTDIQKFSGFSELLSAAQLVELLNYYLTKMSDIIIQEDGTVDKFEGDAIIALIGAPVPMEDHAQKACAAAIKMKKAELEMNREIREIAAEKEKPKGISQQLYEAMKIMVDNKRVLFTRIGLNSGEMIAGWMGSEGKKNYTMMGNNVNLASRLEGVNKQYSTGGILISEKTRHLIGDRFVVRSLDRVKVVNVNTPIRLYELLEEKKDASQNLINYCEMWEKTYKLFENRVYDMALINFKKLQECNPKDKVCAYYIMLLENFFIKGKYPVEQDDVGVVYLPEENVFKLLQK